ncbi:MAG: AsmA-like C-terminal region-containing protein, partial [Opitutaceae bacterium]
AAPCTMAAGRIHAVFPLLGGTPAPVQAQLETDRLEWHNRAWADRVRVDLAGTLAPDHFDFTPQTARVTAARGEALAVPFAAPCVTATLERLPHLQGSVSARIGGSAVTARGTMDIQAGEGTLELTGSLTPALLDLARNRSRLAVLKWVELSEPAAVHATVELAPGWKPVRAEADVSVRQVTAHEVHLDAAGGHVLYAGHDLRVTELLLLQGANEARGSYTMDTATRDYRFLLQGRLRPPDIAGWFKAWWPRFWGHFDFTAVPPSADVDVTGRWGAPPLTTVFCQVDAAHPAIRGVPFDRVRTILFFRANYYHVFAFDASQAGHAARGSFTLEVDHQHATYRTLDFDVFSGLVPAECARLYGPAGTALVAPYQFSEPPAVHAVGHLQGPSAPGGNHAQVNITLESPGHSVFHGLPLEGVKFAADYHDGSLDLRQTQAGFAGGTVSGQARLDGPPGARVLAFDAMLNGADLARVASAAEEFRLAGKPPAAEHPKSRFLGRATGGRLDAALTAEGRYGQPYSFHGKGYFIVTSHDLGEIHLLGLLSELLSKTLLNFTSLRLDTAHGNFKLEGNKLAFAQVKLTGPTAAIDARGDYLLDAKTLDFNAKVFPLQESGFVLTDALGALLTPLSNVLELKLTGPLEKPSWAFLFGPTNFLRALTKPPGPASGGPPLTVPVPSGTEPPKSNAPAPAPQPVKPEG